MQQDDNTSTVPNPAGPRPPWGQLVYETLLDIGGKANLQALYVAIEQKSNPSWLSTHWKAKVRQQVQKHPRIERVSVGVWRIKPPSDRS